MIQTIPLRSPVALVWACEILRTGGVIANSALRSRFIHESRILNLESYLSPKHLATDNALSIAVAGAHHFAHGDTTPWQKLDASASLKLS